MVRIVLADEISPDSCRLWDLRTNEKMDKDRFRRDLGKVEEAYQEVARRLGILIDQGPGDVRGPTASIGNAPVTRGDMKARVHVTLKNGVLDPQGKAIGHSLNRLGFPEVGDVRQGKFIELELAETERSATRPGSRRCAKLRVLENYSIELVGCKKLLEQHGRCIELSRCVRQAPACARPRPSFHRTAPTKYVLSGGLPKPDLAGDRQDGDPQTRSTSSSAPGSNREGDVPGPGDRTA